MSTPSNTSTEASSTPEPSSTSTSATSPSSTRPTRYNWSHVAPAIFGTLFERSLKAERRSLLGRHYTPEADIELIVDP